MATKELTLKRFEEYKRLAKRCHEYDTYSRDKRRHYYKQLSFFMDFDMPKMSFLGEELGLPTCEEAIKRGGWEKVFAAIEAFEAELNKEVENKVEEKSEKENKIENKTNNNSNMETTIKAAGMDFTVLNSIKDLPKGAEIWRTSAKEGYILFAHFTNYQMEKEMPKYAIKCEGSEEIIDAAICGVKITVKGCEKVINSKKSLYVKNIARKALPYIEKLWN